jgi:hypothetical protein
MIKHFFRVRRLGIILAALFSLICLKVTGAAYLAMIGPSPLRFEAAAVPAKFFSWTPPVADKPAVIAQTNSPPLITAVSTNTGDAIPPAEAKTGASVPAMPENLSTNLPAETHSADELLVVTPEMLVNYFKPGGSATNQTNVRVVTPVGFTPPPSAASPSSEAIYRSQ